MPTPEQIIEVHAYIRARLVARLRTEGKAVRVLYGGSVNPDNAGAILALPEVGGVLVGGASLKALDFDAIVRAMPLHETSEALPDRVTTSSQHWDTAL